MTGQDSGRATFGFRDVDAGEKARLVRGVFSSVAARYDLMNDLMSAGVHRVWKSVFVDRLNPQPGETLLDVAGGTGDIAIEFLKRADERPRSDRLPPAGAVVCDINFDMLAAGRAREATARAGGRLLQVCGDAEDLPLPDQSVDAYTIAFGIRNVTRIDRALAEALRVLKRGGRFQCLEFSHLATEGLQKLYDAYSFNVIPWLGEKVAGDRASYQYLVESIRRFPKQERFTAMMGEAGFQRVRFENLSAGVVAIHSGRRI
jgi:demethylmenaquinone methyltransferase/2-methoxy-6-polyprenyl-1,4-benzoquinol methylase